MATNGSSTCFSCPRGRFSTQIASTECEICTSGHSTGGLEEGSEVCVPCGPGTYSSSNYTVKCEMCPMRTYTSTNGSKSCETCPAGTIPHQDVGSSKCDPLPAGQFGTGTSCPINTYSESGAIECKTCPRGKYSNIAASQCIECDFMYRLSTHCDVPYTGVLLIVSALIIVTVASLLLSLIHI